MKIEFSANAESDGSVEHVLHVFKGYVFEFHMKDGAVMTGEIVKTGWYRSRPTVRIKDIHGGGEAWAEWVLEVDEIDKAVYC